MIPMYASTKKIHFSVGGVVLVAFFGIWLFFLEPESKTTDEQRSSVESTEQYQQHSTTPSVDTSSPMSPPSIARMKRQGCVADGLLSDYGDANTAAELVNRSTCYYLHRSLETWLAPPDFTRAAEIKKKITREDLVYGMFIAEAINTRARYYDPVREKNFDFDAMCRAGSENFWGEHTCKPSFEREEYRRYLRAITQEAMDLGVQVFLFGQIYYQESADRGSPIAPDIIAEMREYAQFIGTDIVVGAQTNDIADEKYLRSFDFIEGGVGITSDGAIENGPCHSRWWHAPGDWCWALLWHPQFHDRANNVFIHLDWSGKKDDDMGTFANMNTETRATTLRTLHAFFTGRDIGFLLPIGAPLHRQNGGCYGPRKRYYSPDNRYSCKDEDVINDILRHAQ